MKPKVQQLLLPAVTPWPSTPTAGPRNVLFGLLIEGRKSLGVVECGLGTLDWLAPFQRLGIARAHFHPQATPKPLRHQLVAAGYATDDVTDIFVSHLHRWHTGSLHDFPRARIHGLPDALGNDPRRSARLLPDPTRWLSPPMPPETYHGFASYPVPFEDGSLRLLELKGPFPGHAGWLVPHADGSLLHLGGLIVEAGELSEISVSMRHTYRLLTSHKPFSYLQTLSTIQRLRRAANADLSFMASFVSPQALGTHLPVLGAHG